MKIKETIITEVDDMGRVIKRTRTVDVKKSKQDHNYDHATRYGECCRPDNTSFKRIFEAYADYRGTNEW